MPRSSSTLAALARDRALRRVSLALGLYRLAEFGPWVAMLVFAYDQGGATATGLVSLGLLLPTALFAPFAGPLIDRFGASRVLVGAYTAQARRDGIDRSRPARGGARRRSSTRSGR